ncbi:MAG: hypothetical protein ABIY70_01925 [Capsulimonas sp.]
MTNDKARGQQFVVVHHLHGVEQRRAAGLLYAAHSLVAALPAAPQHVHRGQ